MWDGVGACGVGQYEGDAPLFRSYSVASHCPNLWALVSLTATPPSHRSHRPGFWLHPFWHLGSASAHYFWLRYMVGCVRLIACGDCLSCTPKTSGPTQALFTGGRGGGGGKAGVTVEEEYTIAARTPGGALGRYWSVQGVVWA